MNPYFRFDLLALSYSSDLILNQFFSTLEKKRQSFKYRSIHD